MNGCNDDLVKLILKLKKVCDLLDEIRDMFPKDSYEYKCPAGYDKMVSQVRNLYSKYLLEYNTILLESEVGEDDN